MVQFCRKVVNILIIFLCSNYHLVSTLFSSFNRLKAFNKINVVNPKGLWTLSTEGVASQEKVSIFDAVSCPTAIVGSGPAGLATAIMLARTGVKGIKLFDQLNEPIAANDSVYWGNYAADRSYLIGLNGNHASI
jgi:hypothetical protein